MKYSEKSSLFYCIWEGCQPEWHQLPYAVFEQELTKMVKLQALIFDVDGTLADTERDGHRVAFNRAFAEAGLDWEWTVELYGKLLAVTGGKERIRHFLDVYNTDFKRPAKFDEFVVGLHKAKTRHYTELLATGAIPLRPGVVRLLQDAQEAGLRLAIATTTTPENVDALLQHTLGTGWEHIFELIAAGDIVPAKKPAPDIYHYTLEKMALAPRQCVAFEDSENGILATHGAELATLVTVNSYTYDHPFPQAAIVLDSLGEPEAPFTVLAGDANEFDYVNVDFLKYLHQQVYA
jgi:HAD superfamily hydrolase (TIGR01509 family)